ncbi:MAG: portal protein [Sterolibacterium sp.]
MADKSQTEQEQNVFYEHAGPTLLAMQPDTPKKKPSEDAAQVAQWNSLRGHLEARLIMLRQWRNSWWTQNWSDLAEYILPRRSIWLTQSTGGIPSPNNMTRGRPLNNSIKDPTGTYAARVCSAGLMSGLASPSRPWFKILPTMKNVEVDAEGRAWLDTIEERLYAVLAASNFYNAFAQECEDLVVFGTAPSIIYEDEKDIIRLYNPAVGEYYLASGATLRVDGLYRQFVMTIAQIVDFFGIDACPKDIALLWKQKGSALDQERIIAHSIEPNFDINGSGKIPGNFTWREVYWVYGAGSKAPLSKRGFVDQPFTAARWATQSNDAYGRSPGMDVLPDVIQLQVMTVRMSEAIEKQVRPPLIADITMKNQPSSILPGHVTYVANLAAGTGMRSIYQVNPDIGALAGLIKQIEDRIGKGLFVDLWLMLEQNPNQKLTAYEVAQKMQEKLQVLGPVIENLITESLKPKLKRVYGIMQRKGMLPPPPDSMKNVNLDVEFISMLALAQKGAATGGLERILALIGNMVAVYPEAKDLLNVDEYVNEMNVLLANPEKILHGPEELAAIRKQQADAMKKQQQSVALEQGATIASQGAQAAQTLSETQIGGGQQALAALIGQ